MRRTSESGFGLLEAVVATTVLAISGAALFVWLGQSLQAASRLQDNERRVQQQLTAEALISRINPALEPKGRLEQGGLLVTWSSEQVSPYRESVPDRATTPARWRVGLFKMKVRARPVSDDNAVEFEFLQPGLQLITPKAPPLAELQ